MNTPKVSVVIATHNRSALLRKAIASLQAQTMPDWEAIVVPDACTDDTSSALDELMAQDPRIRRVVTQGHLGPGASRNCGIDAARGAYIAILDDDDQCLPHRLEVQCALLDSRSEVGMCFSTVEWCDADGNVLWVSPGMVARGEAPDAPDQVFRFLYTEWNYIRHPTVMVRSEIAHSLPYPARPWVGEDLIWCLTMAATDVRMQAIREPLVKMNRDPERSGLMREYELVLRSQREIIRYMREWLRRRSIRRFDHLHRAAWANVLAREARARSGFRGLLLCSAAIVVRPTPFVRETLWWGAARLMGKVRRWTGGR
ncbi:MAG TPA: glycosyltransferase family 2 protein [Chthonomonadales bacterium]|nr:glycosyltransferase family 2 protein [Chthonomonadales bacterium]